jgi:hypothetical protein
MRRYIEVHVRPSRWQQLRLGVFNKPNDSIFIPPLRDMREPKQSKKESK